MIRIKQTLTEAREALEHAEGRAQHLHTLYVDALENMVRRRADLALIGRQDDMEAVIDAARDAANLPHPDEPALENLQAALDRLDGKEVQKYHEGCDGEVYEGLCLLCDEKVP